MKFNLSLMPIKLGTLLLVLRAISEITAEDFKVHQSISNPKRFFCSPDGLKIHEYPVDKNPDPTTWNTLNYFALTTGEPGTAADSGAYVNHGKTMKPARIICNTTAGEAQSWMNRHQKLYKSCKVSKFESTNGKEHSHFDDITCVESE